MVLVLKLFHFVPIPCDSSNRSDRCRTNTTHLPFVWWCLCGEFMLITLRERLMPRRFCGNCSDFCFYRCSSCSCTFQLLMQLVGAAAVVLLPTHVFFHQMVFDTSVFPPKNNCNSAHVLSFLTVAKTLA